MMMMILVTMLVMMDADCRVSRWVALHCMVIQSPLGKAFVVLPRNLSQHPQVRCDLYNEESTKSRDREPWLVFASNKCICRL